MTKKKFYLKIIFLLTTFAWLNQIFRNLYQTQTQTPVISGVIAEKYNLQVSHDKYCDSYGEWIELSEDCYAKKKFSFYLIEQGRYRTFLLLSNRINFLELKLALSFSIFFDGKLIHQHTVLNAFIEPPWQVEEYAHTRMNAWFDLKNLISLKNFQDFKKISMQVNFINKTNNIILAKSVPVRIKSINKQNKKSSLLCTKCLYMEETEFKKFNWWIEINKKVGYNRLVLCNSSIPDTGEFRKVLEKHQNFLLIEQLKCLPNFLQTKKNTNEKYLKYYQELKVALKIDVFSGIFINECYLSHIDQYRYITIVDNDETIIPKNLNQIKTYEDNIEFLLNENNLNFSNLINPTCNRFESTSKESLIELFIKDLAKINGKKNVSYNFDQGFFLKFSFIEFLFKKFKDIDLLNKDQTDLILEIKQDEGKQDLEPFNFIFSIKNLKELNYAKNLYKLYFNIIKPFRELFNKEIQKYVEKFDRLFVLIEDQDKVGYGKTIHNTQVSFDLTLHQPLDRPFWKVPLKYGYLSHFRDYYQPTINQEPISILNIQFDLNYFDCYFKPIMKELMKETKIP